MCAKIKDLICLD